MEKVSVDKEIIPGKIEIEQALVDLQEMFNKWGLTSDDYVLVDEIAYVLQGYEVIGEEMKTRHLDTYININKLPWQTSKERSIIPPADSNFFEDYCGFMKITGFGLDMLATTSDDSILQQPMINYELPSNKTIQLMEVSAMTRQFWQKTLMHYSLEDVGNDKVKEWLAKLELIGGVALKKGETQLATDCQEMLGEARERWKKVLRETRP